MADLNDFREETRIWLEKNCPASMRTRMVPEEAVNGGQKRRGQRAATFAEDARETGFCQFFQCDTRVDLARRTKLRLRRWRG